MNRNAKALSAIGLALSIPCLSLPASASTAPACAPIPGWAQVLAREELQWIVIGEVHGTAETPAIFADTVCLTAKERGPVVVGLEVPSSDQAIIDTFMDSDGGPEAQAGLLKALLWNMPMKDGRSSEAFFRLFARLRQMHNDGILGRIIAFQDNRGPAYDPSSGQGPYEELLAAVVREAAADNATVIALVGNTHARKSEIALVADPQAQDNVVDFGKPFMPMAGLLPPDRTLTLFAIGNGGGSAWVCQAEGCGPHDNNGPPQAMERGVELGPVMGGAYDGVLWLGVPTTASPPQATE